MILDLTQPIESSADLTHLRRILSALVGQPFLKAEFSYGDELKIHFGSPVPYVTPKMVGKTKGSWRLGTRGSHWRFLLVGSGLAIDSEPTASIPADSGNEPSGTSNDKIKDVATRELANKIVAHAALLLMPADSQADRGIGVTLLFEDESSFRVWPSAEGDDEGDGEPIADWELFTPFGMYLRVGPGLVWQYLSAGIAVASV